ARVEVELEAELLRVLGTAVGDEADLAGRLLVARPRAHDERIVDGEAPDLVDTLRLQLVEVVEVARHVLRGARRGEGARQPEDRDLLALGLLAHVERVRPDAAAVLFHLEEFLHLALGQLVADLDRHARLLVEVLPLPWERAGVRVNLPLKSPAASSRAQSPPRRTRFPIRGSPSGASADRASGEARAPPPPYMPP